MGGHGEYDETSLWILVARPSLIDRAFVGAEDCLVVLARGIETRGMWAKHRIGST